MGLTLSLDELPQSAADSTGHRNALFKSSGWHKNQIDGDDASARFFDDSKVPVNVIPNAEIFTLPPACHPYEHDAFNDTSIR
jgi:hypothetical protein